MRQIAYGNGQQLTVWYDNRLHVTRWDASGVFGREYEYDNFSERSGQMTACAESL
jgi:hypothetical protein